MALEVSSVTYLLVDLGCLLFPLILSFHPRIRFHLQWRAVLAALAVTLPAFAFWDIGFTASGIWQFNSERTIGINIAGLPLEEYLFFICIPFACLFTFHVMSPLIRDVTIAEKFGGRATSLLINCGAILLVLLAAANTRRIYTAVTFGALGTFILVLHFTWRKVILPSLISYAVILVPFTISNGILTGSFGLAPVVIYDDAATLGIRIFNIPFEDIFYGLLMHITNTVIYQGVRRH